MVAGTLYTFAESSRALKSRVAAAHSGASLKVVELAASDRSHQHVPCFESDDKKTTLFEANSIAYYVSNEQLRGGASHEDRTAVVQWTHYSSEAIASAVASWVFPALSLVEAVPAHVQRAKDDLKREFAFLDNVLKTRTYLVGERLTLADISVAADLWLAYKHVADETFRKPFVNVNRWFLTVVNQTHFKKVAGEAKLAVKAPEFEAARFAQNSATAAASKKQEKPKAEKPAAAPAAKKEAKKPAADEAEEEDEIMAEEPKLNDPFAALPKGNFNMDEFKRTYSNNDTVTVALPYFWKNFEKDFYSIWFCEYKYADELAKVFMTSNLIGGMYQRIERLRKNAFGSMCVFGEDGNNTIAGVWFWKGQELAFPLSPDWTTDYESYDWRKMDPANEADRKLVDQFWSWEGDFKGKKFAVGKIFK